MAKEVKVYIVGSYRQKKLITWLMNELINYGHTVGTIFGNHYMKDVEGFTSFKEYVESESAEVALADQVAYVTSCDFFIYVGGGLAHDSILDMHDVANHWSLLGAAFVEGVRVVGVEGKTDAGLCRKMVEWFIDYEHLLKAIDKRWGE